MDSINMVKRSRSRRNGWQSLLLFVALGTVLVGCSSRSDVKTVQDGTTLSDEPTEAVFVATPTAEMEAGQATEAPNETAAFTISSPAFSEGDPIPVQYSCDGEDQNPALEWSGTPAGTVSLALVMDDPDAPGGTWVHWVLFNIPSDVSGLPSSIPASAILDDGSVHGANSWGRSDYGGPCPPGGTHRYVFKLYALDSLLELADGADPGDVEQALLEHLVGEASLMGTYTR
jgi:Raf kinase inhibitor-like YbhB/YbcL family protein